MPEAAAGAESDADVIVIGSGGAGLMAALVLAEHGRSVTVLEKAPELGGTTAISGGMVWVPGNDHMDEVGQTDSDDEAFAYLDALAMGTVPRARLTSYVRQAPHMLRFLEKHTPARLYASRRPDYRAELPGGRLGGRSLDNLPFDSRVLEGIPFRKRMLLPITDEERRLIRTADGAELLDPEMIRNREEMQMRTLGSALAGALLAGCAARGVGFVTSARVLDLRVEGDRVVGVDVEVEGAARSMTARSGVVVATGGFEWNADMCSAFLGLPEQRPASPPFNTGDGIAMCLRLGAALGNMTEAWWVACYQIPGEEMDGHPKVRHIAAELALPGTILVNRSGKRFVNEASNYNDLVKAIRQFEPHGYTYPNVPVWAIIDSRYKRRYTVASVFPKDPVPTWWATAGDLAGVAALTGVDAVGLEATVAAFNAGARRGVDPEFHRGEHAHDRYYGDERHAPNPCLGPLEEPPFHAIEVRPGSFGTKGGVQVDEWGRVLRGDGGVISGLYAAGNTVASLTGAGYPGAGATLGPALTGGYTAALHLIGEGAP